MSKNKGGVPRGDVNWLSDYLKRHPAAASVDTDRVLKGDSEISPMAKALADIGLGHHQQRLAAKSKAGLSTKASYMVSLLEAVEGAQHEGHVEFFPDGTVCEVVVWFAGARMLTINQMISLFTSQLNRAPKVPRGEKKKPAASQSGAFNYFKYKNRWQEQMKKAIDSLRATHGLKGGFVHPVKIEVMRHATRPVDRDALSTMFKILTDAMRHNGIIQDDNPEVVVDVIPYQKKIRLKNGQAPGVGMRVIAQPGWVPPPLPDVSRDWLRKRDPDC